MKEIEDLINDDGRNHYELNVIKSESSFSIPQAHDDIDNDMMPKLNLKSNKSR